MQLFLALFVLHLAAGSSKLTTQYVVENCTSIPPKYPSRRNYGRPIQQLIGGQHVILARETLRNIRNINNKQSSSAVRKKNSTENNNYAAGLLLLTTSTGNRRNDEGMNNNTKKKEVKKTLSSQVAEGKYGLIHEEIFKTTPNRPGVLSYKTNSDVPKDDARSFGGLKDEEIWLSENYLLVLKGGYVNKNNDKPTWKPIDDYNAPARPVKLSSNPKVPPPFPVQLVENGPIQFIGNSKQLSYNPFTNQSIFLFSNERVPHIKADDLNNKNAPPWNGKDSSSPQFNGYQYPPPAPLPLGKSNQTFSNPFLNLPLPIPGSLDEQNNTYIDEDDPSLYYPPPYSFEYKSDYNNSVEPGPLVPGIILPPPPNFFAALDDDKKIDKQRMGMMNNIRQSGQNGTSSETVGNQFNLTTNKSASFKPITVETPSYKIEIEKVNVKKFPDKTNNIVRTFSPGPYTTTSQPPNKDGRTKPPRITQLHKINPTISHPLISLNPENFRGNPIYFEYFDARTPFYEYPTTTPIPTTTIKNKGYNFHYKKKTTTPQSTSILNQDIHNSKTFLPVENGDLYVVPGLDNYNYRSLQEFNREIETIKQTLRLYENSLLGTANLRTSKVQTPDYNLSFDYRASIAPQVESHHSSLHLNPFNYHPIQPMQRPYNRHSTNSQQKPKQLTKQDPYNYYYKDYAKNVEVTSAGPSEYTTFTTANPFYYRQPNLKSFDKISIHEILKPSIYNNGASGYNTKLYLPEKSIYETNISCSNRSNQQDKLIYPLPSGVQHKHILQNQEENQEHLERDIMINYKHPLPNIHPESEFLPYSGRIAKPIYDYQLSSNKAQVYFTTSQE